MMTLTQIAVGGAIGASLRYLTGMVAIRIAGPGFPWGTLAVNIIGSFAMGVIVVLLAKTGNRLAPFAMTGVLGGFTTFSAFSLDTLALIERGQGALAFGYATASVLGALAAVFAGLTLGRAL